MCGDAIQYVFNNEFKDVQVKDLVKTKQLEDCDLYGTEEGLNNKIKSATVMDIEEIEPWLNEGDVLFISRFMRSSFSKAFITAIHGKKVSCIVTQKKFRDDVTEEQLALLRLYHLPLIFVSDDSSWSGMIVTIQNLIIQNQTNYLVENQAFQNSIINYLSSHNAQNSLCDIIYSLTKITIAITNRNLQIVDYSKDHDWEAALDTFSKKDLVDKVEVGKNFNEAVMTGYSYLKDSAEREDHYFVLPDRLSRYGVSFYIIVKNETKASILPPQVIGRIETIESIYSLKHSIISDLRKSNYYFKSVVFEELLEMSKRDEKKRATISLNLRTDLKNRYYLLMIKNLKDETICKNVDLLTGFIDFIKHKGFADEELLLFVYKDNWVLLLDDATENIKGVSGMLHEFLTTYFENHDFAVGVSTIHPYWELKQAFKEASFAVDFLHHNHNKTPATLMYSELGIIKMFTDQNGQINDVYTGELFTNFLEPILIYDQKHATGLYETLVTFFANDVSFVDTSKTLFIHVNTLRARIKTIEKILNIDLNRIDNLITIRLAILLYQFGYFEGNEQFI